MTDNEGKALREAKAYLAVNGPCSQAASILARLVAEVEQALVVYVGRVYDSDVGEDRGLIERSLPASLIGEVRLLPVGERK